MTRVSDRETLDARVAALVRDGVERILLRGVPGVQIHRAAKRLAESPLLDGWSVALNATCTSATLLRDPGAELAEEISVEVPPLTQLEAVAWLRRSLAVGDEAEPTLAALAESVAGLPDALSVLAARARVLPLQRLLERITPGAPNELAIETLFAADPEQVSVLRRSYERCWDALDGPARVALRACASFASPFEIDAAEAVINASALQELQTLRDTGWLRSDDAQRLYLLGPTRLFALSMGGPDLETVARHDALFEERTREWGFRSAILGDESVSPLIEAYRADLLELVARGLTGAASPSAAVSAGLALATIDERTERARGSRQRLESLAPLRSRLDPDCGAWLAIARSRAARFEGDFKAALALLPQDVSSPTARYEIALQRAAIALTTRELDGAERAIDLATELARATGRRELSVRALHYQGHLAYFRDDLKTAYQCLEDARATAHQLRAPDLATHASSTLALICSDLSRDREALAYGLEALTGFQRQGSVHGIGATLNILGTLALNVGDLDAAAHWCQEAASLYEGTPLRAQALMNKVNLADISYFRGDLELCRARLAEARYDNDGPSCGDPALLGGLEPVGLPGVRIECRRIHGLMIAPRDREGAIESWRQGFEEAQRSVSSRHFGVELALLLAFHEERPEIWLQRADEAARVLQSPAHIEALRLASAALLTPNDEGPWISAANLSTGRPHYGNSTAVRQVIQLAWGALPYPTRRAWWAAYIDASEDQELLLLDTLHHALRAPGEGWEALRRPLLWRLLSALVEAPWDHRVVSIEELYAAGWPGEQIIPKAASNRLHNALSLLRQKGLAGTLVRTHRGYTLRAAARGLPDLDLPIERLVPLPLPAWPGLEAGHRGAEQAGASETHDL